MSGPGINWAGPGSTVNMDVETGIRYGVVPQGDVLQAWSDSSESDYGEPACPECGGGVEEDFTPDDMEGYGGPHGDLWCGHCRRLYWSDQVYSDEPLCWYLTDGEYKAFQSHDDSDIFVEKSPYYCMTSFCSPCAPGAGYVGGSSTDNFEGIKAYCFGPSWYDDEEPCQFHIWCVAHDKLVYCPRPDDEMPEGWTTCPEVLCPECTTAAVSGFADAHQCPQCEAVYVGQESLDRHIQERHT